MFDSFLFFYLESRSSAGVGESGSHWELVFVNGSNWQVVTLGLESALVSDPGQSDLLAFRGNVIGSSLVGVSSSGFVRFFSVSVFAVAGLGGQLLLGVRLVTSGSVRSGVAIIEWDKERLNNTIESEFEFSNSPPGAAAVDVSDIGLGHDGDLRGFVLGFVAGRSGGGDGQESGDDEL
jgi:hypothetical protein